MILEILHDTPTHTQDSLPVVNDITQCSSSDKVIHEIYDENK